MLNSNIIRYVVIAGAAYFVDLGGFWVLLNAGINPIYANILVKIAAAIFGFFFHRRFTYGITSNANISRHALKYFGLALIYTPASTLMLFIFMNFFASTIYSKIASDVVLFIVTYLITTHAVFTEVSNK